MVASSADISVNVQQKTATVRDSVVQWHAGALDLQALIHFGCIMGLKGKVKTHLPPPSWLECDAAASTRRAATATGDTDICRGGEGKRKKD